MGRGSLKKTMKEKAKGGQSRFRNKKKPPKIKIMIFRDISGNHGFIGILVLFSLFLICSSFDTGPQHNNVWARKSQSFNFKTDTHQMNTIIKNSVSQGDILG